MIQHKTELAQWNIVLLAKSFVLVCFFSSEHLVDLLVDPSTGRCNADAPYNFVFLEGAPCFGNGGRILAGSNVSSGMTQSRTWFLPTVTCGEGAKWMSELDISDVSLPASSSESGS
ncbi:unnamed protein product [Acanthoscelides obtectus]|uniref:Uncharacterized protein n=1 Tax=Acanthoscelides obtectus TaxID=200917 RepID=A0A9P0K1U6_ACAOB|nr:unnamed protein product [Acanthoscelides obtectus]CAK1647248.1 hypothetical protein AOBTE_LOCUS15131 [Acanthoscelides obtectus]